MLAQSGAAWGAVGIIGAAAVGGAVTLVAAWWARSNKVDRIDGIDIAVQAVVDQLKATNATAKRADERAALAQVEAAQAKAQAEIAGREAADCKEWKRQHMLSEHGEGDG